jgi:predicted transcriptional regulator
VFYRGLGLAKYRNRLQIIAEILEIVREGAKKTHIMYKANLSYRLLCRYLNEVLDCGLVRVDRKEDCYVVAPKGEKFLEQFNSYMKRREHVKKELKLVNEKKTLLEQRFMNSKAAKLAGKKG